MNNFIILLGIIIFLFVFMIILDLKFRKLFRLIVTVFYEEEQDNKMKYVKHMKKKNKSVIVSGGIEEELENTGRESKKLTDDDYFKIAKEGTDD